MDSFRSLQSQSQTIMKHKVDQTGSLPNATVDSKFNMVMTNGSAMHDREIYDFTLTDMSTLNNSIAVFNGTAIITMRQGPVTDVPVSIKATGKQCRKYMGRTNNNQ